MEKKIKKYRNYSHQDIIDNAAKVKSMAGLLKSLDLKVAGGNYDNMRRLLQKLNVNCDHWTGQAWCRYERLKDWSEYTKGASTKPHLIKERGHKCENCLNTAWMGGPIKLEIHHVDGDKTNNNIVNLQLLCPNCHSYTDTYRVPKYKLREENPITKRV